jgi:hypothetical protein
MAAVGVVMVVELRVACGVSFLESRDAGIKSIVGGIWILEARVTTFKIHFSSGSVLKIGMSHKMMRTDKD